MVKTRAGNGPSQTTLTPATAETIGAVNVMTGCFAGFKKTRCIFGRLSIGKLLCVFHRNVKLSVVGEQGHRGRYQFGGAAWKAGAAGD